LLSSSCYPNSGFWTKWIYIWPSILTFEINKCLWYTPETTYSARTWIETWHSLETWWRLLFGSWESQHNTLNYKWCVTCDCSRVWTVEDYTST
jgi:hypothetical protein